MTVHQPFFSSRSPSTGVEATSGADDSPDGRDSVDGLLMNSPDATSKDVLVQLSSGTVGEDENHPPGKKREEVVDSSLLRDVAEEGISKLRSGRPELPSSHGEVRRNSDGFSRMVCVDSPAKRSDEPGKICGILELPTSSEIDLICCAGVDSAMTSAPLSGTSLNVAKGVN